MRRRLTKSCLVLMVIVACLYLSANLWPQEKLQVRLLTQIETREELAMKFEISITGYTTIEEVSRLKESYSKGGYESFISAFRSMNKGTFSPIGGRGVKIVIHAVHSIPTDKGRKILLFTPSQSWDADAPRIIDWRYPFMLIELEIDHKGKGKGKIYEQVSITLTEEGTVAMDSYFSPPLALWGVRALAQPKPEEEEEETGEFRGIGLSLKFSGGGSFFDSGDFERGSRGEFEAQVEDIVARGFTIDKNQVQSLNSGYEIGAELIYMVAPRIGIGLGFGRGRGNVEDILIFYEYPNILFSLSSAPNLKTAHIRLGILYWLLMSRLFSFYVTGGVGLYQADYNLNLNLLMGDETKDFAQSARGKGFGVHGGGVFELALNPRASLFIEAQGRYARLRGFEGWEVLETYPFVSGYKREGTLYYLESEQQPRLAILESEPAGARKALLNLWSLSIWAGLRFKF